jgi:hypothetical protein
MDHEEARAVLRGELARYRACTRAQLERLLSEQDIKEARGKSGTIYQVEIEAVWESRVGGSIRVLGHIDDGGVRALLPLTEDFIVAKDGGFVGE